MEVEHAYKAQAPPSYTQPIQGRWAMGQRCEWVWSGGGEKGEPILGFPLKLFWGEMSYWDDISPKISKHEWESLDAYHRGR